MGVWFLGLLFPIGLLFLNAWENGPDRVVVGFSKTIT